MPGMRTPGILPITALVYSDGEAADRALRSVCSALRDRGCRLAGLVQHNRPNPGRSRCDMELEDLASGALTGITQDRGRLARGCSLDIGQLLNAMQITRASLHLKPDLVILNKFGKTEAEGGGLRPLIAETIEAGLPLLVAVPWRNIEGWRHFTGEMAREYDLGALPADEAGLCAALGLAMHPGLPRHREPHSHPSL